MRIKLGGLLVFLLAASQAPAANIELGIHGGMTYTLAPKNDSSFSYSSKIAFPVLGLNIEGRSNSYSLKSYLEYTTFTYSSTFSLSGSAINYESKIFNWISHVVVYAGRLYVGPGGGLGYYRSEGVPTAYPWLSALVGYQFTNRVALEARGLFLATATDLIRPSYYIFQICYKTDG